MLSTIIDPTKANILESCFIINSILRDNLYKDLIQYVRGRYST